MGFLRYSHAPGFVPPPGHNGGRSQTNTAYLYTSQGDWPFLNAMKLAPMPTYQDNFAAPITPDLLNADGYPLATSAHGFKWQPLIPPAVERAGNYIVTWDGTGTTLIGAGGSQLGTVTFTGTITGTTLTVSSVSGTVQPGQRLSGGTALANTFIVSGSGTTWTVSKSQSATATGANGGSLTSSGGAGAGYYGITTDGVSKAIQFVITAVGSPIITNVQVYNAADAGLVAAGETFGAEFKRRLIEANFGVIRFLNWQDNNISNVTTWNTRKPVNYIMYQADQINNSFYAGTATHTSDAYVTSQFPAIHSSDGTAWTTGGPKDRDTIHVVFTNAATATGPCSLSVATSATPKNMLNPFAGPLSENAGTFYPITGVNSLATLIYDAKFNAWIKHGGDAAASIVGISNVVPIEICLQLCKEVGAHPYFCAPYLSLDPATDFMAELAQYCKTYAAANAPWMIPRFEGPNETWNGNTFMTGYAGRRAVLNWGAGDFTDQYGKWMANLGQMCAAVYGASNLSNTYHVLCGVQTSQAPSANNEKLAATKYAAQAAAADSAITGSFGTITFTKQAAKFTTSHFAVTNYMSGSDRYTINELINAFAYSVTNKGNSSAQATLANAYCDTLLGAATSFNLNYLNAQYLAYKPWGATFGVNKMTAYEGCYSPDLLAYQSPGVSGSSEADAWWSSVTGRTQINPAIMQLTSSSRSSEGATPSGNPAAVGMAVTFSGTSTAFDNPGMYTRPVTFAAASPVISGTNTLKVNQAVYFRTDGGTFPTGFGTSPVVLTSSPAISYTETFYVIATGLTSSTFRVSTSRGGTAITFSTAGSGAIYMQEAWFITNVDAANNRVTLDLDSTGFTAPTTGTMSYCKSMIYSNNLRQAGKLSPNLQAHTITNYNNFTTAGGEYPSNYLMGGPGPLGGNVWFLLEPLEQSPNPPQWLAIIAYNH